MKTLDAIEHDVGAVHISATLLRYLPVFERRGFSKADSPERPLVLFGSVEEKLIYATSQYPALLDPILLIALLLSSDAIAR